MYYLIGLLMLVGICILFLDFSLFRASSKDNFKDEEYIDEEIKNEMKIIK